MKLSTRNQIKGKVMEIRKGAVTAIIYVQIPGDVMIETSTTIAGIEELGLFEGKNVTLVVNPGDIIIACD
jgi:molybdopterin-binding protein